MQSKTTVDKQAYTWDFFLAHAGKDNKAAQSLYNLLAPYCRVFLDSINLLYGDDWDVELPAAQRNAFITIVLVSASTDSAYYQREEIAGAINMARTDKNKHRVVPVFLENATADDNAVPYGLRLKHGLYISKENDLAAVSKSLLDLLKKLEQQQISTGDAKETAANIPDREGDAAVPIAKQVNPPATNNTTAAANDLNSLPGVNNQPNNIPIQQPAFKPFEPFNPLPFHPEQPAGVVLRCVFANDPNAYYITNANLIVTMNPFGQKITIGRRIPPVNPNFAWMYQTPYSTYGVTFEGYIFAAFPNGQTMQIGYVTHPV